MAKKKDMLEKKLRRLYWDFGIVVLCFMILSVLTAYLMFFNKSLEPETFEVSDVYYQGLNDEEKEIVEEILRDIDEDYFSFVKSITFVKSMSNSCENSQLMKKDCHWCLKKRCVGWIDIEQNIVVEYQESKEYMKSTICHEIAHSFIDLKIIEKNTLLHKIVNDLGDKQVCLK